MAGMNQAVARENAETLEEAKVFGEMARLEIAEGPRDDPAQDCAAARAVRGQAFTVDNLPALPLPACNARECDCTYVMLVPDGG